MQFAWIFLKIFKYIFLKGNLRKTMKKTFEKKKKKSFILGFHFFQRLYYWHNTTVLYVTIPKIWSNIW